MLWTPYWLASVVTLVHVGEVAAQVARAGRSGGDSAEGQPWTATMNGLADLRTLGRDPTPQRAERTVRLIGENSRWEYEQLPYWGGEVEERINGRTVADGVYFGVDMSPLVERLVGERQPRRRLELRAGERLGLLLVQLDHRRNGLIAFQGTTGGTPQSCEARAAGEAHLLERRLYRLLPTGEPADPDFVELGFPYRWYHNGPGMPASAHWAADADPTFLRRSAAAGKFAARIQEGGWRPRPLAGDTGSKREQGHFG